MIGTASSTVARRSLRSIGRLKGCVATVRVASQPASCLAVLYPSLAKVSGLIPGCQTFDTESVLTSKRFNSTVIFSSWTPMEWHKDTFLSDATVQQKEQWLASLIQSGDRNIDVEAFLFVLKALSNAPRFDVSAARRAEQWMIQLQNHPTLEPTTDTYAAVIQAWANASKEIPIVIVNRAEKWLNELLRHHQDDPEKEHLKPTIELYNAYLDACTRGRLGNNKRDRQILFENSQKADALLRRLHSKNYHQGSNPSVVAPNTESFNLVLRGWSRCPQNLIVRNRIMGLLRLMEAQQRENSNGAAARPNTKSYCIAMDSLVRNAKAKALACIKHGGFDENDSVNGIEEVNEAEAILNYMHSLHDAGLEHVVPHRVPYNVLISGWAGLAEGRHFNAPFRAEEILRKMISHRENGFKEASPDRISYEKVMRAWANSSHTNAGQRAKWWLKQLWNESELQGDKNLLPTVNTYNIVIRALANSDDATTAENLLLDLGDKYRAENSSLLCPNSESFAIVIQAWIKQVRTSKHVDTRYQALVRAKEWLGGLCEIENERNLSTTPEQYHGVLNAAARCATERPETLELAREVFVAQQQSRYGVDGIAYGFILQVVLRALSSPQANEERYNLLDELVQNCKDDGCVGNNVVHAIARSKTYDEGWTVEEREDALARYFHTWPFPASWTRNIRSKRLIAAENDFDRAGFQGPPVTNVQTTGDEPDEDDHQRHS